MSMSERDSYGDEYSERAQRAKGYSDGYAKGYADAKKKYSKRPHGEWEHWGSPFTDDTIANSIVCSICKARYVEIEGEVFNICPNCGADMTEGGDEGCPNRS